ncbi:MAG TPA: SRPBCC family protein [Mycobacteriales bacterium]|nr:SRPBCC family protein [Mycobacteriales bacterium]
MGHQEIDVRVRTAAAPGAVYRLLTDGASWPVWSPLGSFELARPGEDGVEGVGAVRVFRTWPATSRERIVELVPDRRLSYELMSGLPLRAYRADIDLKPDDGGTTIRWHSTFRPVAAGTGWFFRWMLGGFVRRCAEGLANYAATVELKG